MPGMPGGKPRGTSEVRVWVAVGGGDFARYLRSALDGQPGSGFRVTSDPHGADVALAETEASPPEGIALLADLRADVRTSHLRVLFLGGGHAARARLVETGDPRIAFLDVPFNARSLRAAVRRLIER